MKRLVLQVVLMIGIVIPTLGQVKLNEIQTSNSKTKYDPDFYKYKDWVELYNTSATAVNLSGYYLTDNKDKPRKWQIPTGQSIPGNGYLLIWCDGEDIIGKGMHTNFKLSSGGDVLFLYAPTMLLVDSVNIVEIETDYTYGRLTDGTGAWALLSKPTPAATNVSTTVKGPAPKPTFSLIGGFYPKSQSVTLSTDLQGAVIRYTTDGSEPTEKSPIYTGAITVDKVSGQSLISGYDKKDKTHVQHYQWQDGDGALSSPSYYDWGEVQKGFVLKAKVFHDDYVPSVTACQTYFINMSRPSLPVVSVTVDKGSFFSADSGIYIQGTNGVRRGGSGDVKANWNHEDWERKVHVEYFDINGNRQFGVNAGAKVMGAISRHSDLKSLNIVMKKKYEDGIIDYPIFGSEGLSSYESFVLRNAGNDWEQGMFARDAVAQSIVRGQCDLETQAYQPVVMYLNGEYWSLINLRERYDKHYFGNYYDYADESNIDLLKIVGDKDCFKASEGDSLRWEEMMLYLKNNSMEDADNYNYVKNHYVDVDNMINYYIAQLYCQNTDWPNNNMRLWRPRTENGKFRFPWYDTDFGYGLWGGEAYTNPYNNFDSDKSHIAVKFFYYMMANSEFKSEFIQRFYYMINTVYDPSRSKSIINDIEDKISKERSTSDSKWARSETARYSGKGVSSLLDFAERRPDYMRDYLNSKYGSKGTAKLTVNFTSSQGSVKLCGLNVKDGYKGAQYKSTPIRMTAIPKDGYKFRCWQNGSGATLSTDIEYFLTITGDYTIKAVFESRSDEKDLYINEFLTSNSTDILTPIQEHQDWIEIYNGGTSETNLAGLYLSDDRTNLGQYQIPYTQLDSTNVPSKGFVLFYADNDYMEGALHLPFKLDKAGGVVILSQKSASGSFKVIDSIHYEKQNTDVSYGRYPDGSSTMSIFTKTTPRATNKIISDTYIDGLVITEFMAKNETVVREETGRYADWFEVYNSTDDDINMGGLFVTNSLSNPTMYMIPKGEPEKTTIKAGEYFIFWCDKQTAINPNHVDFKLSADAGDIAIVQLRGSENYIIDQVTYASQGEDMSFGRYPTPETTTDFIYMLNPTPGSANKQSAAVERITGVTINEVLALNTSVVVDEFGSYSDYIEVYNGTKSPIDLGGLYISDSIGNPLRYKIPTTNSKLTTVQAGKWLILWADGRPELGENHLGFSLDGMGEAVILSQMTEEGVVTIDEVSFSAQTENISYGRYPEMADNWETMTPTYLEKNQSFRSSVALKTLASSVGTILPALSTSVLSYECAVPAGTESVPTISATAAHDEADVTITQASSLNDVAVIKVISANGFNSETYKVSFKIAASSDATLASLVSAGGTMEPAYNPDVTQYVVTLSTTFVPYVTAIPTNENAMVDIDYAGTASETTIVTVTAEDGSTKSYEITYVLSSSQNVVTEWSDDFEKGIDNLSTNNEQHIISANTTVGNTNVAIALNEKKEDLEFGYVEYHLPKGYVLDGSAALNVSFDVNVPSDGKTINGVTVSNQYINLSVALVDMYGTVSNYMNGEVNGSSSSYSVNFGSASFISKSAIVAVRIALYAPEDSKKERKKAMYLDNLVIGPQKASGVSQTVVLSSNADLKSISASAGTLSPAFSKTTTDYVLTLEPGTTTIPTISALLVDETATLEIAQASNLNGMAYVKVISQDMSEVNEYAIQLYLTPEVVDGYADMVIQPAMLGWSESSSLYEMTYNGGDVAIEYNRTAAASDAISFNVRNAASKILDMTEYPYASVRMKSTVDTKLFIELFDSKGNKTAATLEAVDCEAGSEMVTYIFDLTDDLGSVDISDIYGMNIYFDKGSSESKTGTIKIDEIRFGSEVEIKINKAPIWKTVAEQVVAQGEEFSNLDLSAYVSDDYTEFADLTIGTSTTSDNLSVTIENGFLIVAPKSAEWIGSEGIKVTATDADGESSYTVITYTVEELKIPLTDLAFTQESVSLDENGTLNLAQYLKYTPSDATIETIEWSVSDKNNAKVSGVGVLTNLLDFGTEDVTVTVVVVDKNKNTLSATLPAKLTGCATKISSVKLQESQLTIFYGETATVGYSLLPAGACKKSVSFTSSNPSVATVAENGLVTASAGTKGTTTITVSVNDGFSVKTAECLVSVTKDCTGDIELSLNKSSLDMLEAGEYTLVASITPDDECTQDKVVEWSSSNDNIATCVNGTVVAVHEGEATIKATTTGNGVTTATCLVKVSRDCTPGAVDVEISETEKSMYLTDDLTLTAEITTPNPCNDKIIWTSSDETVVKVADGEIAPLKYGTATIRATASQDKNSYAECVITVKEKEVETVTITASSARMYVGETKTLTAVISPNDAENQKITWSSRDESLATVSQKGVVTALKNGRVTIVATAENKVYGEYEIELMPIVATEITLSPKLITLTVGEKQTVNVEFSPENVTDKSLDWESHDATIASVDESGVITAKAVGSTTVIATSSNGVTAFVTVEVAAVVVPVTSVEIESTDLTLNIDDTKTLTATVLPDDATNKSVTWESSDKSVATISTTGVITAVGAGTTVITASSVNGKTDEITVTVNYRKITSVDFDDRNIELKLGRYVDLSDLLEMNPTKVETQSVVWSVNSDDAEISEDGVLTNQLEYGSKDVVVTAKVTDMYGTVKTASKTVTIIGCATKVSGVTVSPASIDLAVSESANISVVATPLNACVEYIKYESQKSSVVTVENGIVKPVGEGETSIIVTISDGYQTFEKEIPVTIVKDFVAVKSVVLDETMLNKFVGDEFSLTANVIPDDATNQNITWSSSNKAIATVDDFGNIKALKAGNVTITASAHNGEKASCYVKIQDVEVTKIVLNKEVLELKVLEKETLTTTLQPENASATSLSWSSDNEEVATVADGLVVAKGVGSCIITVDAENGVKAVCNVSVSHIEPTQLVLSETSLALDIDKSSKVKASWVPLTATDTIVEWKSEDVTIAKVSDGVITGVSAGNTVITATIGKTNISATIRVTVNPMMAESITVDPTEVSLIVKKQTTLSTIVLPEKTTDKSVTWTSSDNSKVSVDNSGKITALALTDEDHPVTITAKTVNGLTAVCKVIVTNNVISVEKVTINPSYLALSIGEYKSVTAEVSPSNASNKSVRWESENPSIATVSYGTVTAKSIGETTIIAKSADNEAIVGRCYVRVSDIEVESISLNDVNLAVGEYQTLTADINPSNATNVNLQWSVDDETKATINPLTGKITGIAAGTTTVTVTAGNGVSANATVTITETAIAVKSISASGKIKYIDVDNSVDLSSQVVFNPTSATNKSLTWSIYNQVATYDDATVVATLNTSTGVITGKVAGTATVKVTSVSNPNASAEFTIRVNAINPNEIVLNKTELELVIDNQATLTAKVYPDNASDKTVTWSSSDNNVASVSSKGVITAYAKGTTIIYARSALKSSVYATCKVTVVDQQIEEIIPSEDTLNFTTLGGMAVLSISANPSDAEMGAIEWESSNPSVISIEKWEKNTYMVSANAYGTAFITITASNGVSVTVPCIVKEPVKANTAPKISAIPDQTLKCGEKVEVDLNKYYTDLEGDAISWNIDKQGSNINCDIDGNGIATFTVADEKGKMGMQYILVYAKDSKGASANTNQIMFTLVGNGSDKPEDTTHNVAVETLKLQNVVAYPTVTTGPITISFETASPENCLIEIYSMVGRKIYSEKISVFGEYSMEYDLAGNVNGGYIIFVTTGKERKTVQVLLK